MTEYWSEKFLQRLAHEPAVLITVTRAQGSVPREAGTAMAVFALEEAGTIGGGHLELQAITLARQALGGALMPAGEQRHALGPSLGQCCGGVVFLAFEKVSPQDVARLRNRLTVARAPVALFGGGHVGRALVHVLSELPLTIRWIDSRDAIFPSNLPPYVLCEQSEPVQSAVMELAAGSRVLIMSFSHAEDLEIVAACLQRLRQHDDLPYIGLIGSASKWARFRHRLEARGFGTQECERVTCPIGIQGIAGKEPGVIAVAVAAQLLQIPWIPGGSEAIRTKM
jgi:xanthine dehydrogenase accessory factor